MLGHIFAVILFVVGLYLVFTGLPARVQRAKETVRKRRGLSADAKLAGIDPSVIGELLKTRVGIGFLLIAIAVLIEVPTLREFLKGSSTAPADTSRTSLRQVRKAGTIE
jgi:hypothetical protein